MFFSLSDHPRERCFFSLPLKGSTRPETMGHSILKQFIANSPCSEAGRGRGPPKGSTGGPSSTRGHYYKRTTEFQIGRISELRGGQGSTGPTRGVHWPNSGGPQALHRGRRARAKPAIRTAEAGSGVTDPRRLRNAVREPRGDSNCISLIKKECFVRMSLKATAPPPPSPPPRPQKGVAPPTEWEPPIKGKQNKVPPTPIEAAVESVRPASAKTTVSVVFLWHRR